MLAESAHRGRQETWDEVSPEFAMRAAWWLSIRILRRSSEQHTKLHSADHSLIGPIQLVLLAAGRVARASSGRVPTRRLGLGGTARPRARQSQVWPKAPVDFGQNLCFETRVGRAAQSARLGCCRCSSAQRLPPKAQPRHLRRVGAARLAAHGVHLIPPHADVLVPIIAPTVDESGPGDMVSRLSPLGFPCLESLVCRPTPQAGKTTPMQSGAPQERGINHPDGSGPAVGTPKTPIHNTEHILSPTSLCLGRLRPKPAGTRPHWVDQFVGVDIFTA